MRVESSSAEYKARRLTECNERGAPSSGGDVIAPELMSPQEGSQSWRSRVAITGGQNGDFSFLVSLTLRAETIRRTTRAAEPDSRHPHRFVVNFRVPCVRRLGRPGITNSTIVGGI